MSGNHNRSLERALAIVDAAADAGAHAIKLQTYTADSMTVNVRREPFVINDPKSLWNGRSLYDLYAEAATPYEWHAPIMERAKARGLECFSTPFDESAIDFLESLNVPAYKIASFELIDLPLIRRVAATGKPMIMSTGMATLAEIHNAVECARSAGCRELFLLKCTSTYPASPEDSNIATIPHLRDAFGTLVGLSDHTMGAGVSVAAVALGAAFIEKHFTLARSEGGVDSAFSMEPAEFRILSDETTRAWQGLGKVTYSRSRGETSSLLYRRSVLALRDIGAGESLTRENIGIKRPGHGLKPAEFEIVLGKRASRDIKAGEGISWDMV
jgi:N-acetylneuraminate synthase